MDRGLTVGLFAFLAGCGRLGFPASKGDDTSPVDGSSDASHDSGTITQIAFMQTNTTKPSATSTVLALGSPVAMHDAIIMALDMPTGPTVTGITDTLGNTYDILVGPVTGAGDTHYIAAAYDTAEGTDSVTLTLSAKPDTASDLFVAEYSGIALVDAYDVSAHATGNSTAMASGSATTTDAHELIFGFAEAPAATPGSGFTARAVQSGNLIEDMVVTSAGSYQTTATTTSGAWTMFMVTFKGQ